MMCQSQAVERLYLHVSYMYGPAASVPSIYMYMYIFTPHPLVCMFGPMNSSDVTEPILPTKLESLVLTVIIVFNILLTTIRHDHVDN